MTSKYFCNLIVLFCVCVCAFAPVYGFSGGNGTAGNPYQITSVDDMLELNDSVIHNKPMTGKYFILVNDIDTLRIGIGFENNSSVNYLAKPFRGIFDGNYHKITIAFDNSIIDSSGYIGLFFFVRKFRS
ncbi:MAG: hypothetical protein LBO69_08400 [Ignavibacteria bacterium]|jgi:hypothetical protein|nr:hypothetical protein [Ignavibacteria bacterium]